MSDFRLINMDTNRIMKLDEVAEFLRLSTRSVYDLARKGEIPCRRILSEWRFDREQVTAWACRSESKITQQNEKSGPRILIVDDEDTALDIMKEGIAEHLPDSEIKFAKDGVSALVEVGKFLPHIILLDIKIPGVDGIDVCRRLKSNPQTKDIDYLGIPYFSEALIALYLDEKRNTLNGMTVNGKFFRLNIETMELFRYGTIGRMAQAPDRIREIIMDKNGFCYFNNDVGGLTKFDPETGMFTDIDITLPGKLKDFRASIVSSDNVIYAVSNEGFVWSYAPETNTFKNLGHIFGLPEQPIYTPNIALDEEWDRLYFLASNHGGVSINEALGTITILDLNTGKFHWIGKVDGFEGCFGALTAKDHNVYFSCLGFAYENDEFEKGPDGRPITRPYLLKYEPPSSLK